jgi:hypothetical protein
MGRATLRGKRRRRSGSEPECMVYGSVEYHREVQFLPSYLSECSRCSLKIARYFFTNASSPRMMSKFSAFFSSAAFVKLNDPVMIRASHVLRRADPDRAVGAGNDRHDLRGDRWRGPVGRGLDDPRNAPWPRSRGPQDTSGSTIGSGSIVSMGAKDRRAVRRVQSVGLHRGGFPPFPSVPTGWRSGGFPPFSYGHRGAFLGGTLPSESHGAFSFTRGRRRVLPRPSAAGFSFPRGQSVNSIQVVDSFPHFLGCFASQSRVICCAFISCSGVNFLADASLYCALFV